METRSQRIQKQEAKKGGRKKIIALTTAGVLGLTAISGYAFQGMENNKVLQKLLDEAERMVEDFASNKAAEITELNASIDSLTSEKTALSNQLTTMTNNYNTANENLTKANNTIAENEAEIERLEGELAEANQAGLEKDGTIADLEGQIETLTSEKQTAENERDGALAEIEQINQIAKDNGYETIEEYIEYLTGKISEHEDTITDLEGQIEQLAQDLAEEEEQNAYLQSLVDNAHDESLDTYNVIAEITGNETITEVAISENLETGEIEIVTDKMKAKEVIDAVYPTAKTPNLGYSGMSEYFDASNKAYKLTGNGINYLAYEDENKVITVYNVDTYEKLFEKSAGNYSAGVKNDSGKIVLHIGGTPEFEFYKKGY